MRTSDTVTEITKSLVAAQSVIKMAEKNSENPHFKSKYADLASIVSVCREALSQNGIAYIQSPEYSDNLLSVTTRLMHTSGEWIEGTIASPVPKLDPQGIGAAVTYCRRYSLAAMVGVAPADDDDAEAVVRKAEDKNKSSGSFGGPLTATKLKAELRALAPVLNACHSQEELKQVQAERKDVIDQCKRDLPSWFYPQDNADGESLSQHIERLMEILPDVADETTAQFEEQLEPPE